MYDLIGFLAGILTIGSYLPQVIKSWKTRRTQDLSIGTGILLIGACICWVLYGFFLDSMPMMITNSIVLCCVLSIIAVRLFFEGTTTAHK